MQKFMQSDSENCPAQLDQMQLDQVQLDQMQLDQLLTKPRYPAPLSSPVIKPRYVE